MDNLREALQYLVSLGNPDLVKVGDRDYTAVTLRPVVEPKVNPLGVHTLTGLTDYLSQPAPIEGLVDHSRLFIQVESSSLVNLYGILDPKWKERDHFIQVTMPRMEPYPFEQYLDIEKFVIQIQAKFVQDEMTKAILARVGNITASAVKNVEDDGTTQQIQIRAGINRSVLADVPNPVTLRPYRTFNEIEQPASKFVLRLKRGDEKTGAMPTVALFQADGGQWELEAILKIKEWLQAKLPDIMIIA